MDPRHKARKELLCRCNNISREVIEQAIRNGCRTLDEIFDETTAGVGPCGGTCRAYIRPMIEQYLRDGTFPAFTRGKNHR